MKDDLAASLEVAADGDEFFDADGELEEAFVPGVEAHFGSSALKAVYRRPDVFKRPAFSSPTEMHPNDPCVDAIFDVTILAEFGGELEGGFSVAGVKLCGDFDQVHEVILPPA